jgi:hypothetical protein
MLPVYIFINNTKLTNLLKHNCSQNVIHGYEILSKIGNKKEL